MATNDEGTNERWRKLLVPGAATLVGAGAGLNHHDMPGRAARQPTPQERTPHLATSDEEEGRRGRLAARAHQASPCGSIIAAAIASSAPLPPHTTSWKAG